MMVSLFDRARESLAVIAAIILTAAVCLALGKWQGHRAGLAEGATNVLNLKASYAEAAAQADAMAQTRLRKEQDRLLEVEQKLFVKETELASAGEQLKRKVQHVTTVYRSAPTAPYQALPVDVFTGGFIGLYNAASATATRESSVPEASDSASAPDQANTTSATRAGLRDPAALSGVTPADLLAHHIDMATYCAKLNAQVDGLIAVLKGDQP